MAKLETGTRSGASGTEYPIDAYSSDTQFNPFVFGVYIVSRRSEAADGSLEEKAIYVGESEDIAQSLRKHDKQAEFEEHGYNAITIYRMAEDTKRRAAYEDLVQALSPVCN